MLANASNYHSKFLTPCNVDSRFPQRGFDRDLLGSMFSLAVLGNSVVAISAGIVAQVFADRFGFV